MALPNQTKFLLELHFHALGPLPPILALWTLWLDFDWPGMLPELPSVSIEHQRRQVVDASLMSCYFSSGSKYFFSFVWRSFISADFSSPKP